GSVLRWVLGAAAAVGCVAAGWTAGQLWRHAELLRDAQACTVDEAVHLPSWERDGRWLLLDGRLGPPGGGASSAGGGGCPWSPWAWGATFGCGSQPRAPPLRWPSAASWSRSTARRTRSPPRESSRRSRSCPGSRWESSAHARWRSGSSSETARAPGVWWESPVGRHRSSCPPSRNPPRLPGGARPGAGPGWRRLWRSSPRFASGTESERARLLRLGCRSSHSLQGLFHHCTALRRGQGGELRERARLPGGLGDAPAQHVAAPRGNLGLLGRAIEELS